MNIFEKYFDQNISTFEDVLKVYKKFDMTFILNSNNIDMGKIRFLDPTIINLVKIYFIYIKDYISLVGFERYQKDIENENNFNIREFDALLSGIMFFYFSYIYVIMFPKWQKTLSGIVKYNVLYLLIDHYFDDDKVDEIERKFNMEKLVKTIISNDKVEFDNIQLKEAVKIYNELIEEYPQCKPFVKDLLFYEIESVKIQKNNNLNIEDYYKIAILKGGYTMLAISSLFKNNEHNYEEAFLIGAIMQLIDDSLDINEDIDNNIVTYATKMKENGNIDNIFYDIFGKIELIKNHDLIVVVFVVLSCYLPNKYPENYSKPIFNITNYFNILPVKFPVYLLNYLEKNKITLK